jgi:sulfite reductase alpha subunit-like flavoprotein
MHSILTQLQEATESLSSLKGVPKLSNISIDVDIFSKKPSGQSTIISKKSSNAELSEYSKENPFIAAIKSNKILFSEKGDRDAVYEITLDITGMNWNYQAGDCIGIVCKNEEKDINSTLSLLGLTKGDIIHFKSNKPAHFKKDEYTAYDLFSHEVDLKSIPKKQFFRALAEEAGDDTDRRNLLFLSSISGKNIYTTLRDKRYSVLDVLSLFPSSKPSLHLLLEYLLPLQPRYYSVCHSKYLNSINNISFMFNVLHLDSISDSKDSRRGLCTGYLEDEILGISSLRYTSIFPRIAPVPFRLKPDVNEVILIANGTGLGPFIGFLEELQHNQKHAILLYGHRTHFDKLYKDELLEFIKDGTVKLIESLSRVENHPHKYVQDAILSELSWNDVSTNPIYLCGSSAMGKGVFDTLIKYKMQVCSSTFQEASKYWADRICEKSFLREIWA